MTEALKDASGSTGVRIGKLARALVVVEVALATGFLIMTMTFTRSAVALRAAALPFDASGVFTGQLGLSPAAIASDETRAQIARELLARLDATPGVEASGLASVLPGRGAGAWPLSLDAPRARVTTGTPQSFAFTGLAVVTPGFFDVLGARVVQGRLLDDRDRAGAPAAAVVNESWVALHSSDREPIGRRIWIGERAFEVVGVVADLQMQDPGEPRGDGVYAAMAQVRPFAVRVLARVTPGADPLALTPVVRDAAETIDPDLPVFEVATLREAIFADKQVLEAFSTLFLAAGVGALFLTMVGVYGVVAFAVASRTREIGVRVALGATKRDIARLVVGQGAALIAGGTAVGLLLAFGISQAMAAAAEFFEPAGFTSYLAIVLALSTTAVVALVRPVRRALALDPMEAMRQGSD